LDQIAIQSYLACPSFRNQIGLKFVKNIRGGIMQNRINDITERQERRDNEPQPIGEILKELLIQYEQRFPNIHVTVVETTATAV
jgi:hypothetical protein